jgi:hypothetical protein
MVLVALKARIAKPGPAPMPSDGTIGGLVGKLDVLRLTGEERRLLGQRQRRDRDAFW